VARETPAGRPIRLADHVAYNDDAVVSKTLVDKKAGTLTLFAFDAGQTLSEHTSPFDAVVQVLDGEAVLVIGGQEVRAAAGELVVMPANVPHAVRAEQRFKMLLTLVR
jgi:quercetin dioxygenase-like cupin family protein